MRPPLFALFRRVRPTGNWIVKRTHFFVDAGVCGGNAMQRVVRLLLGGMHGWKSPKVRLRCLPRRLESRFLPNT